MVMAMPDDEMVPDHELAQELIGDMAELLNKTKPLMLADSTLLAGLTLGLTLEAAFGPAPPTGLLGLLGGSLLACFIGCWLVSMAQLALACRPILGIVSDHRWKAGAPLDPRARWLSLPPVKATREEWIWVRAHLLVGAARIRMTRVQTALVWTLFTAAFFFCWTVLTLLVR